MPPTTSNAKLQLEWTKTSERRYERVVDDMEKFYLFQQSLSAEHGVQNWLVSSGIKIHSDHPIEVSDVKRAWTALRYKHPALHAHIEGDKWVYEACDEAGLTRWLDETFFVHEENETSSQLHAKLSSQPLKRALLYFLPHTQEVCLRAPHTHLDGIGLVIWYNNFLEELASSTPIEISGTEVKNLIPALTTLAEIPPYTEEDQARLDSEFQHWRKDHPTVYLASTGSKKPGRSTIKWLRFSKTDTKTFLAAVKSQKITVASAAQAAIALAARAHGHNPDIESFATFCVYNAREYITPKYEESELVSPYVLGTPIKFHIGSFLETAHNAGALFVSRKENKYLLRISPYYSKQFPSLFLPAGDGKAQPLNSNAHLSSYGRLDGFVRPIYEGRDRTVRLVDLWTALDIMTPDVLVTIFTLWGEMTVKADYNEAFFSEEHIQKFLGMIVEELESGLQIHLNPDLREPGKEGW